MHLLNEETLNKPLWRSAIKEVNVWALKKGHLRNFSPQFNSWKKAAVINFARVNIINSQYYIFSGNVRSTRTKVCTSYDFEGTKSVTTFEITNDGRGNCLLKTASETIPNNAGRDVPQAGPSSITAPEKISCSYQPQCF